MGRVDEVLEQVRADIERRRASGQFAPGYEAGFEDVHNAELGKVPSAESDVVHAIAGQLEALRRCVSDLSSIERDSSRFGPLRYLRELAMSRHQLIRLNHEMRRVAEALLAVAETIVETETKRSDANLRASTELLDRIYERTILMERLWIVSREMEARISRLENGRE